MATLSVDSALSHAGGGSSRQAPLHALLRLSYARRTSSLFNTAPCMGAPMRSHCTRAALAEGGRVVVISPPSRVKHLPSQRSTSYAPVEPSMAMDPLLSGWNRSTSTSSSKASVARVERAPVYHASTFPRRYA